MNDYEHKRNLCKEINLSASEHWAENIKFALKTLIKMKSIFTLLLMLSLVSGSLAYDYQKIDEHARNAPEKVSKDVESLTAYLIRPARSDREKVRSFFIWIAEHIHYDVQAYQAFDPYKISKITPNDVLRKKEAVCQGYSELFQEMCRLAGIQSYVVPGYSKGFGYLPGNKSFRSADHAWNAVKVDAQWYLLDATWGSGGVSNQLKYVKQLNERYFLSDPKEFVKDHMPLEPVWQLLPCPVSMKSFIAGDAAIERDLSGKKKCSDNYHKVIADWETLPEDERKLQSAVNAYAFNPDNHAVMARGYVDHANTIMRGIKTEMRSKKEIEEGVVLQEKALEYLRKADALLAKVKDNAADMEKQIVKKNMQVSEQNLKSMKSVLK